MSIKYELITWCHCSWIKGDKLSIICKGEHRPLASAKSLVAGILTISKGTSAPHLLTPLNWCTSATRKYNGNSPIMIILLIIMIIMIVPCMHEIHPVSMFGFIVFTVCYLTLVAYYFSTTSLQLNHLRQCFPKSCADELGTLWFDLLDNFLFEMLPSLW